MWRIINICVEICLIVSVVIVLKHRATCIEIRVHERFVFVVYRKVRIGLGGIFGGHDTRREGSFAGRGLFKCVMCFSDLDKSSTYKAGEHPAKLL